jgi:aspartyl-tRNA(Asn)/glutamyl-tRNA(Gln) amidotransferase subunit A
VQASREHRRIIAGMRPLREEYDVLLTAGYGPAPRLDAYRTIGFWRKPNIMTFANVIGGPALELCIGFSSSGLPLGMQLIGWPFDEPAVLRAGHAYERATAWRAARPTLTAGTQQPSVAATGNEPATPDIDADTRQLVVGMAQRAGLRLDEYRTRILFETAPYALAMAQRMHQSRDRTE